MPRSCVFLLLCAAMAGQAETRLERQSREILNRALKDRNPDTRKQAVLALSLAGSKGPTLPEIASMLDDKDVKVRVAAVTALSDFKDPRTIDALQKALNDSVPEVAFAAAKALWELRAPAGRQVLLSVLAGQTKTSSGFITNEMRDAMRLMHTPRTMLFLALRQGIGFVPLPGLGEGIASVQGLLSDPGVSGRATAALLLGKEPDPPALAALRNALRDKDWSVRAAAVHSLALHNDPDFEPDILPLLADDRQPVRLRAAAACLRLEAVKHRRAVAPGARGVQ